MGSSLSSNSAEGHAHSATVPPTARRHLPPQFAPTPIYAQGIPEPTIESLGDATADDLSMLFSIMKGTAATTGAEFFQQLCRHLAVAIGMRWAAITELLPDMSRVRTIAFCDGGEFLPNFEYALAHTPCEEVLDGQFCLYPTRVADTFPDHHEIRDFGIDSYMGVPLVDKEGKCLGHLYVMDDKPIPAAPRSLLVFRIFASRATSELIRERAMHALAASEERFHRLAETAPTIVYRACPKGRFTYVNERWSSITGLPRERGLHDHWADAIHPDDREGVIEHWNRCTAIGQIYDSEFRFVHASGSVGWALARAVPQRGENGQIEGWVGTATDVTDIKHAQAALRLSEQRFRAVLDSSMDAVLAFDAAHTICVFNAAAERILGAQAPVAVGATIRPFTTPELYRQIEAFTKAPGDANPHVTLPRGLRAVRSDGSPFPIEATLARVNSESGPLFTLTLRDVEASERDKSRIDQLARENTYLRQEAEQQDRFHEIIGDSPALVRVLENVRLVAPTDSTVLIQGETGTGKELVARSLHNLSSRRDGPFVRVNCAALPAGLVESEFFGHERGAFTGAVATRAGRFELASGGTIFLDEIGEVSPDVQVKLLRVLQESEFERVGGSKTVRVNVRVLAATNRNLSREVEAGRFRADLFYRLSVFPIDVPPLRAREGDVAALILHFVKQCARSMGKHIASVEPATMSRLNAYTWPGNIRELRNVIERAVILCTTEELTIPPETLGAATRDGDGATSPVAPVAPASARLEDIEREHIRAILGRTRGAIAGAGGAAELLGIPPSTLRSRMAKLGIRAK